MSRSEFATGRIHPSADRTSIFDMTTRRKAYAIARKFCLSLDMKTMPVPRGLAAGGSMNPYQNAPEGAIDRNRL